MSDSFQTLLTPPTLFIQFQANCMEIMIIKGKSLLLFLAICQISKIYGTLKIFVNTRHMGLEIKKHYFYSLQPQPNFVITLAIMAEYRRLLILTIGQVLKFCGTLKF